MRRPSILFLPENKAVPFLNEESVLTVALQNKVEISHSCGGMGSCTTCRIFVESDLKDLAPRNDLEAEIAEERGFANHERLACQLTPVTGMKIRIPLGR